MIKIPAAALYFFNLVQQMHRGVFKYKSYSLETNQKCHCQFKCGNTGKGSLPSNPKLILRYKLMGDGVLERDTLMNKSHRCIKRSALDV